MTSGPSDYFSLRVLGTTGLKVTPLSLGTAALGDMPDVFAYSVTEDDAQAMLREAFTGSINFIDTAASYGDGESERRIGNALRDIGGLPEGWVLGTKADRDLQTGEFSGIQMQVPWNEALICSVLTDSNSCIFMTPSTRLTTRSWPMGDLWTYYSA